MCKNETKIYAPLKIDFKIPEILQENIDLFIKDLNERNGQLADCYEQEIRSLLNGCDECLTEEQIDMLRWYYCKGGIYMTPQEIIKHIKEAKSDEERIFYASIANAELQKRHKEVIEKNLF